MTENGLERSVEKESVLPADSEEPTPPDTTTDAAVQEEVTLPDSGGATESVPGEDEAPGTGNLLEKDGGEGAPEVARLADEFLRLADEIPWVAQPEDLPDEVWETAAQGVPLRDAYLRFWFAEWGRKQEAAAVQARTAAGSAGSLRDIPDDPRPEEAAFTRSFLTSME